MEAKREGGGNGAFENNFLVFIFVFMFCAFFPRGVGYFSVKLVPHSRLQGMLFIAVFFGFLSKVSTRVFAHIYRKL